MALLEGSMPVPFDSLLELGDDGWSPRRAAHAVFREPLAHSELRADLSAIWRKVQIALRTDAEAALTLAKAVPNLSAVERIEAERLIAFCTLQSLAYRVRVGEVESARRRAAAVLSTMGDCRTWVASTMHMLIDPETLAMPAGSYSYSSSHRFGDATFEQSVLLVSRTRAALLIWEDED